MVPSKLRAACVIAIITGLLQPGCRSLSKRREITALTASQAIRRPADENVAVTKGKTAVWNTMALVGVLASGAARLVLGGLLDDDDSDRSRRFWDQTSDNPLR